MAWKRFLWIPYWPEKKSSTGTNTGTPIPADEAPPDEPKEEVPMATKADLGALEKKVGGALKQVGERVGRRISADQATKIAGQVMAGTARLAGQNEENIGVLMGMIEGLQAQVKALEEAGGCAACKSKTETTETQPATVETAETKDPDALPMPDDDEPKPKGEGEPGGGVGVTKVKTTGDGGGDGDDPGEALDGVEVVTGDDGGSIMDGIDGLDLEPEDESDETKA